MALQRRRIFRAIATLLSLALAVASVEVVLRRTGGIFQDRFTAPDQQRGWQLRPGFGGWMGGHETPFWVTINSAGMRDVERAVVPPAGTLRVAVLGDSYVQGIAVRQQDTLTTFLERDLAPCVADRVEALNFGVTGYGTAQELLTWRSHARSYQPDIAVLAFYTDNDVFNNVRALNPTLFPEQSPYFTLDGNALVLDTTFRQFIDPPQPWWRRGRIFLTERLRTAQLLHDYYGRARAAWLAAPEQAGGGTEGPDLDLEQEIYREPWAPDIDGAWRVTEALLLQWAEEVRADGVEPWIVTLANAAQVNPSIADRGRVMSELHVSSLFYPDHRIQDFAARHGIAFFAVAPPMAEIAAQTHTYMNGGMTADNPPGQGHWNERGNAVGAELIAGALCQRSAVIKTRRAAAP
jgi:hypothetical protein